MGKSSITTQLALSLSLTGKSVGILDIDLTGPSIPRFLGLENAKIKQAPGGWLPVEVHKSEILAPIPELAVVQENGVSTRNSDNVNSSEGASPSTAGVAPVSSPSTTSEHNGNHTTAPPRTEDGKQLGSLHAISLAFLLPTRSSAVIWRGPKKTAMVRQFLTDVLWPPSGIDYLLIDTPPGTSDEHIALAETLLTSTSNSNPNILQPRLAGAVIVTTPQAVAVSDVRKEVNFCKKTAIDVLGVVENMAGFVCECCGEETNLFGKGGGEVMAGEFGVPFLGRVAMDGAWGRLIEEGRRPTYGTSDNNSETVDVEGEYGGGTADVQPKESDPGSLVDKYRSCKLSKTFKGITQQLIGLVEGSKPQT